MTPELEKAKIVMLKYAALYKAAYGEKWLPKSEHIAETLQLFKSPLEGFDAFTPEELCARLELFFKDKWEGFVSCRHNYTVFLKHVHRFVAVKAAGVQRSGGAEATRRAERNVCDDHPDVVLKDGAVCPLCYPVCEKCKIAHWKDLNCEDAKHFEGIARRIVGQSETKKSSIVRDPDKTPPSLGEILGAEQ